MPMLFMSRCRPIPRSTSRRVSFLVTLLSFLVLVLPAARPQEAAKPLNKTQVMELVKAGMDSPELAEKVRQLGIDFDLTDDYIQGLRAAGAQEVLIRALRACRPRPLTRDQVLELVAGHIPGQRATNLVRQRGIDFSPDEEYLQTLRVAGAEDALLDALRVAGAAVKGTLQVVTSPAAEVSLDGQAQGYADAQGELTVSARPGDHGLKVSLKDKKTFVTTIRMAAGQATRIEARLESLAGAVLIRTAPGAQVFLDAVPRGTADAGGQLAIRDVPAGSHEAQISAVGKEDYHATIIVTAGQTTTVTPSLVEVAPVTPTPALVHAPPEEAADLSAVKNELDPDRKIARAEAYVAKYPNSQAATYAYSYEAEGYQTKGDLARAVEVAEKSIVLKKDNLMSLLIAAYLIPQPQYLKLHQAGQEQELSRAEAYCYDAFKAIAGLQQSPSEQAADFARRIADYTAGVHGDLGMIHLDRSQMSPSGVDRNELAKAEDDYKQAISLSSHPDASIYYRLGEAYKFSGRNDDALAAFTKADELGQGVIKQFAEQQIERLRRAQ